MTLLQVDGLIRKRNIDMNGIVITIVGGVMILAGVIISIINLIYSSTKAKSIKKTLSDEYRF